MSGPINWQNVGQYSLADVGRPLEAASRGISGAFDSLTGILKDREAINNKNFEVAKVNNTNSYLNQVAELGQTFEALQRAMQDGTLDKIRASLGPNIDQGAVRGAAERLLSQRFAQQKQAIEMNNFMTDEKQAPERDAIMSMLNSGDPAMIAQGKARLNEVQLRNEAALYSSANAAEQQGVERGRDTTRFTREGEKFTNDRAHQVFEEGISKGQLDNAKRQTAISAAGVGIQQKRLDLDINNAKELKSLRYEELLGTMGQKLGEVSKQSVGSAEGAAAVLDNIRTSVKDPKQADALIRYASEAMGNPENKNVSVAKMLALSLAQKDDRTFLGRWVNNNSYRGEDLAKNLIEYRKSEDFNDVSTRSETSRKFVTDRISKLTSRLEALNGGGESSGSATVKPSKSINVGIPFSAEEDRQLNARLDAVKPKEAGSYGPNGFVPASEAKKSDPAAQLKALASRESTLLNQGKIDDFSPTVKKYFESKSAVKDSPVETKEYLRSELERELKKARGMR